jgi:carboxymethylenebutenolidase
MSCPDCIIGTILEGEPTGIISAEMDGAYFAANPEGPSTRAVILLTDVFGLPVKNGKILADKFAKELHCDVWAPDYFAGMS